LRKKSRTPFYVSFANDQQGEKATRNSSCIGMPTRKITFPKQAYPRQNTYLEVLPLIATGYIKAMSMQYIYIGLTVLICTYIEVWYSF